ncbi:MAG: cytochrome P450 [Hyphomicrobiaceae bacterium]
MHEQMTNTGAAAGSAPRLDTSVFPALTDLGFTGGRDSFQALCAAVFASDEPRFLRAADGSLVVFRHADLRAIGASAKFGNATPSALAARGKPQGGSAAEAPPRDAIVRVLSSQVFFTNDPIHAPIRRALLNQMGPKPTAALEPLARQVVTALLSELGESDEIDLVTDIAEPLTVRFWGALIGLTDAEMTALTPCVRALTPLLFMERTREQSVRLNETFALYGDIIEQAALRSLKAGGHPFVEALAAELAGIHLEDDPEHAGIVPPNVGLLIAGNVFDGFHTAALAAANTVFALSSRPEIMAQVRATPAMLAGAITEALRLEPPVIMLDRHVLEDVVFGGFKIPKGSTIVMMWGAGNFDPNAFQAPFEFDLTRGHQGLTTFGGGLQICPGRFIAVMLTRVLLEGLAESGMALEPVAGRAQWIPAHKMCQLSTFPVRVRRGDA